MKKAMVINPELIKKAKLTDTIYSFYFSREGFDFIAGQYVQMLLPHDDPDDYGSSRYFTIASSPTEKEYLMITTRKRKSSFKKALFRLKPGDKVHFFGPIGTFVIPQE